MLHFSGRSSYRSPIGNEKANLDKLRAVELLTLLLMLLRVLLLLLLLLLLRAMLLLQLFLQCNKSRGCIAARAASSRLCGLLVHQPFMAALLLLHLQLLQLPLLQQLLLLLLQLPERCR